MPVHPRLVRCMASSDRRGRVDISSDEVEMALEWLPHGCFKKGEFMPLSSYSWKKAPEWDIVAKLHKTLDSLIIAPKGLSIRQKSFAASFWAWSQDKDLVSTAKESRLAAYTLRPLMGQLLNHKQRDRLVPRPHRRRLQTMFDKFLVDRTQALASL